MQTEIEKRIEEYISKLGMTHDRNTNPNVIHPPSMKLMAKFILELPELREAVRVLAMYSDENNWANNKSINDITRDRPCALARAHDAIEALKSLGIMNEGDKWMK